MSIEEAERYVKIISEGRIELTDWREDEIMQALYEAKPNISPKAAAVLREYERSMSIAKRQMLEKIRLPE